MSFSSPAITKALRTTALATGLAVSAEASAQTQRDDATQNDAIQIAEQAGLQRIEDLLGAQQRAAVQALKDSGEFPVTTRAVTVGFGEIYRAEGPVDVKTREVVTVAVLGTLGHAEPQLRLRLNGARAADASHAEIFAVLDQLYAYVGLPTALNAIAIARDELGQDASAR